MSFDIQFKSRNGCIYVFIQEEKKWYEFCPAKELPADVKLQINEIKEKADVLKDA
jgi:hypothetical protein